MKKYLILLMMLGMMMPGFSQMVEHVVDKGETFASIAQKYGMTEKQLKEANPKYKGVFFVGMSLNIPQKYANASATSQAQPSVEPQETASSEQAEAPKQTTTQQAPASRHKYYEGDTDKDGRPDGYGTMFFEPKYGNIAYTEKIEGTWKKGVPVSGKAYRDFKENGKPRMKFEGEFKLKKKGVLNYLEDLKLKGDMVFYFYNEDSNFPTRGNQVVWGYCDGSIKNGYYLYAKTKQMGSIHNGEYGKLGKNGVLTAEGQKYYNEVRSPLGSAWILDRMPTYDRKLVNTRIGKKDQFIKLDNIEWSGKIIDGFIDGTGEGSTTVKVQKGDVVYTVKGEFKKGIAVNATIQRNYEFHRNFDNRSDYCSLILSMGDLQDNVRPFKIESLTHKDQFFDKSYSGFVDADFKFKEDYFANEKKEYEAAERRGTTFGLLAVAAVAGAVAASSGSSSGLSSGSSYSSSSREEKSSSSSDRNKNKSSSSESSESKVSVDIENIPMPEYEWAGDWERSTITPHLDEVLGIKEEDDWKIRYIRFSDSDVGKAWISRSPDGKRYDITTGTGYTNLTDAIKAQYVYFKYGKKRETGRIW